MTTQSRVIQDANSGYQTRVDGQRSLQTTSIPQTVIARNRSGVLDELQNTYRFVDSLTKTSFAMNVNGSVTPVVFEIPRVEDKQITFTSIRLILESDDNVNFNSKDRKVFGSAGLLTNGILFTLFLGNARGTFNLFPYPVKKIEDLVHFATPNSLINVGKGPPSTNAQLFVELSLGSVAIYPHNGDGDLLSVTIRDNLTSVTRLEMFAFGHENFR